MDIEILRGYGNYFLNIVHCFPSKNGQLIFSRVAFCYKSRFTNIGLTNIESHKGNIFQTVLRTSLYDALCFS